jgi:hypothetical protein
MIPDRRNLLKWAAVTAGAASFPPALHARPVTPAAGPSASADRELFCRGLPMLGETSPDYRSQEPSTSPPPPERRGNQGGRKRLSVLLQFPRKETS